MDVLLNDRVYDSMFLVRKMEPFFLEITVITEQNKKKSVNVPLYQKKANKHKDR